MDVSSKVEMKIMPLLNKHHIKALLSLRSQLATLSFSECFAKRNSGKCRKSLTEVGINEGSC